MDNKLERLLSMQRNLQSGSFGYDFTKMTGDERARYIFESYVGVVKEIGEALDETDWKPWTTGPRTVRRDEFMNELVDTLHFWINMALAVSGGMSSTELADEIFTRFALKNRTNAQRQVDGYDGRSTKCGGCGRALDDFAVECRRVGDQGYCAKLDTDLNYLQVNTDRGDTVTLTPIKSQVCAICKQALDEHGCEIPTTERWGYCMANDSGIHNIPPIKIPTES